jgi:tetratricopeptide (TPR) repeat protein
VDVLVQEIHDIGLPPRICILGVGGIGKTTLAVSILHHERVAAKFCEGRYFLPCDAITSADLLLAELAAALDMDAGLPGNTLKSVHHKLKQVPCLLVLDNFETPWESPQTRSEIESLLTEIASIETVSLILTMRGSQMPSGTRWSKILPPLQPVDADSAVAIFKAITQCEADKYALKLIKAMDYIPLAITLVANLTSVEGETTENLWIRWQEERTSMVGNGSDRLANLEKSIQLTLSGPRMQQDPGALRFLAVICLPPDGMSSETLRDCMNQSPDMPSIRKAISTLRQNALVYEDPNKYLRVLSPIRLFVLLRHPPSLKARQFIHRIFMKLALQALSTENFDARIHIRMEVANINAILIDALQTSSGQDLNDVAQSILNFCQYTYISGIASTHAISCAVEILEQQQEKRQPESGIHPPPTRQKPLWSKKFQIIEFSTFKSRKSVKIAIADEHTRTPADATLKLLADCFGCWGQILSQQSQFDLAKEKYDRANALHTKSKDVVGQAYDMLNIGLLLSRDFENADQALQIFQESVELHEKAGDMRGKAYDLMAAGSVLSHIFKFEDAKANFTSALTILATTDMDSGALALHGLGTIMLSLSRFEEAEKYFQDATKLNISSGHIVGQAENLAGLSLALLMRSQVSEAQRVIESAIALQEPASEGDLLFVLGRILIARSKLEQAEIIFSRALSLHEATESIWGQAYNLLFLAHVAFLRGDPKPARDLMSQASSKHYQYKLFQADFMVLRAQIPDPAIKPKERAEWLETASTFFSKIGDVLEQARCLHLHGVHHISLSELTLAMEKLEDALKLHVEVGNIHGQADDLNKIAEVLLLKGSLTESTVRISKALVLHTQIEDFTGQGNDLYIQSAILLAKDQFVDADVTIRKAIKLHEIVKSKYGLARDFSLLSIIIWRQSRVVDRNVTEAHWEQDAFTCLAKAMELFAELEASREYDECEERQNIMQKDLQLHQQNQISVAEKLENAALWVAMAVLPSIL